MHITSERNQSEKAAYCMNATMRHSRECKAMNTAKRSVVSRVGVGKNREVNRQSIQDFWSSETALYGIIMIDINHCTFVQTSRMYNTKNKC